MYFSLHFSGRELFLSDSSLFVDDAKAYEKYQRESGSDITEQKVKPSLISFQPLLSPRSCSEVLSFDAMLINFYCYKALVVIF